MSERGKFYTIDGADNAGKTSLLKRIKDEYKRRGQDVLFTREPGGTDEAEEIRKLFLHRDKPFSPRTQLFLVFAARVDHVDNKILPTLKSGQTVWSDRFYPATDVYQVQLGGVSQNAFMSLWDVAVFGAGCMPDLQIFLDIPAEETIRRDLNEDNQGQQLVFEKMEIEAKHKIRSGYLDFVARGLRSRLPRHPLSGGLHTDLRRPSPPVFLVDGMCERDYVYEQVMGAVDKFESNGRVDRWWASNRPEFQEVVDKISPNGSFR